jgi:ketosteroid isomerase-like protein
MTDSIIVDLFHAIDSSDWGILVNLFHPDVVYERPGYAPFKSLERLLHFYQYERILVSGTHNLEHIVSDGNSAACWGSFVGKKRDGSEVNEMFADVYTFEDGKIRTRRSFFFRPAV